MEYLRPLSQRKLEDHRHGLHERGLVRMHTMLLHPPTPKFNLAILMSIRKNWKVFDLSNEVTFVL